MSGSHQTRVTNTGLYDKLDMKQPTNTVIPTNQHRHYNLFRIASKVSRFQMRLCPRAALVWADRFKAVAVLWTGRPWVADAPAAEADTAVWHMAMTVIHYPSTARRTNKRQRRDTDNFMTVNKPLYPVEYK